MFAAFIRSPTPRSTSSSDAAAIHVIPTQKLALIPADPDDDKFVECAVEGKARYIVSGDKHLLGLGSYQGIQVVPPAAFVTLVAVP
jgi:predicted nucleic acid-binding protein